jgi:hypothetical protein
MQGNGAWHSNQSIFFNPHQKTEIFAGMEKEQIIFGIINEHILRTTEIIQISEKP